MSKGGADFRVKKTRPKVISSKYNHVCLYKEKLKVIPPPKELSLETTQPKVISPKSNFVRFPLYIIIPKLV